MYFELNEIQVLDKISSSSSFSNVYLFMNFEEHWEEKNTIFSSLYEN